MMITSSIIVEMVQFFSFGDNRKSLPESSSHYLLCILCLQRRIYQWSFSQEARTHFWR
jgi:hypothetical protein